MRPTNSLTRPPTLALYVTTSPFWTFTLGDNEIPEMGSRKPTSDLSITTKEPRSIVPDIEVLLTLRKE
ncbi:hypothetical protein VCHA53O466_40197 [Vibrio chagasii]|nr:hypothetical protein VCHA53O466_40197 [Vibrio chagasii]